MDDSNSVKVHGVNVLVNVLSNLWIQDKSPNRSVMFDCLRKNWKSYEN